MEDVEIVEGIEDVESANEDEGVKLDKAVEWSRANALSVLVPNRHGVSTRSKELKESHTFKEWRQGRKVSGAQSGNTLQKAQNMDKVSSLDRWATRR